MILKLPLHSDSAIFLHVPKLNNRKQFFQTRHTTLSRLMVAREVMEKFINSSFMKYLEHHKLINNRPQGFRKIRASADFSSPLTPECKPSLSRQLLSPACVIQCLSVIDEYLHICLWSTFVSLGFYLLLSYLTFSSPTQRICSSED